MDLEGDFYLTPQGMDPSEVKYIPFAICTEVPMGVAVADKTIRGRS